MKLVNHIFVISWMVFIKNILNLSARPTNFEDDPVESSSLKRSPLLVNKIGTIKEKAYRILKEIDDKNNFTEFQRLMCKEYVTKIIKAIDRKVHKLYTKPQNSGKAKNSHNALQETIRFAQLSSDNLDLVENKIKNLESLEATEEEEKGRERDKTKSGSKEEPNDAKFTREKRLQEDAEEQQYPNYNRIEQKNLVPSEKREQGSYAVYPVDVEESLNEIERNDRVEETPLLSAEKSGGKEQSQYAVYPVDVEELSNDKYKSNDRDILLAGPSENREQGEYAVYPVNVKKRHVRVSVPEEQIHDVPKQTNHNDLSKRAIRKSRKGHVGSHRSEKRQAVGKVLTGSDLINMDDSEDYKFEVGNLESSNANIYKLTSEAYRQFPVQNEDFKNDFYKYESIALKPPSEYYTNKKAHAQIKQNFITEGKPNIEIINTAVKELKDVDEYGKAASTKKHSNKDNAHWSSQITKELESLRAKNEEMYHILEKVSPVVEKKISGQPNSVGSINNVNSYKNAIRKNGNPVKGGQMRSNEEYVNAGADGYSIFTDVSSNERALNKGPKIGKQNPIMLVGKNHNIEDPLQDFVPQSNHKLNENIGQSASKDFESIQQAPARDFENIHQAPARDFDNIQQTPVRDFANIYQSPSRDFENIQEPPTRDFENKIDSSSELNNKNEVFDEMVASNKDLETKQPESATETNEQEKESVNNFYAMYSTGPGDLEDKKAENTSTGETKNNNNEPIEEKGNVVINNVKTENSDKEAIEQKGNDVDSDIKYNDLQRTKIAFSNLCHTLEYYKLWLINIEKIRKHNHKLFDRHKEEYKKIFAGMQEPLEVYKKYKASRKPNDWQLIEPMIKKGHSFANRMQVLNFHMITDEVQIKDNEVDEKVRKEKEKLIAIEKANKEIAKSEKVIAYANDENDPFTKISTNDVELKPYNPEEREWKSGVHAARYQASVSSDVVYNRKVTLIATSAIAGTIVLMGMIVSIAIILYRFCKPKAKVKKKLAVKNDCETSATSSPKKPCAKGENWKMRRETPCVKEGASDVDTDVNPPVEEHGPNWVDTYASVMTDQDIDKAWRLQAMNAGNYNGVTLDYANISPIISKYQSGPSPVYKQPPNQMMNMNYKNEAAWGRCTLPKERLPDSNIFTTKPEVRNGMEDTKSSIIYSNSCTPDSLLLRSPRHKIQNRVRQIKDKK